MLVYCGRKEVRKSRIEQGKGRSRAAKNCQRNVVVEISSAKRENLRMVERSDWKKVFREEKSGRDIKEAKRERRGDQQTNDVRDGRTEGHKNKFVFFPQKQKMKSR